MNYPEAVTRLGLGSLHPGGWAATLEQLQAFPLAAGSRVLEVGCGTGRTACHLARLGLKVTAVDISPAMLLKAAARSLREGVSVTLREADVRNLPFPDGQFDAVMAESVSIFTDTQKAVSEYCRVLRPGGCLYDREIFAARPIPEGLAAKLEDFFGGARLMTRSEWGNMLRRAGFANPEAWRPTPFPAGTIAPVGGSEDSIADPGAPLDPEIAKTAREYGQLMARYRAFFAYAVFTAKRPLPPAHPAAPARSTSSPRHTAARLTSPALRPRSKGR